MIKRELYFSKIQKRIYSLPSHISKRSDIYFIPFLIELCYLFLTKEHELMQRENGEYLQQQYLKMIWKYTEIKIYWPILKYYSQIM